MHFFSADSNEFRNLSSSTRWLSSTPWNHLTQSFSLLLCSVIYSNLPCQKMENKNLNTCMRKISKRNTTLRSNFLVFGFSFNNISTSSFVNSTETFSEPSVLPISPLEVVSCLLFTSVKACRARLELVGPVALAAPILLRLSKGISTEAPFF